MITRAKWNSFFDYFFLILLFILVIGIPLVFTSYTRSVFEVNKLLLLRLSSLVCVGGVLFKSLVEKANQIKPETAETYELFGLSFKKTNFEIPFCVIIILNLISTVFSQNIFISIIGSYDRWEGIFTVFNYLILVLMFANLVTKKWQLFWVLGGMMLAACLSAFYGVLQSIGKDILSWSVDPTMRVFACINNPVHFSAYVGMLVPVGIGLLCYLIAWHEKKDNTLESKEIANQSNGIYILYISLLLIGINLNAFLNNIGIGSLEYIYLMVITGSALMIFMSPTWLLKKESLTLKKGGKYLGVALVLVSAIYLSLKTQLPAGAWVGFFVCTGFIYIISPTQKGYQPLFSQHSLKRFVLLMTLLIYYALILSYSRASWLGFVFMSPILISFIMEHFSNTQNRSFIADILSWIVFIGLFSFIVLFKPYLLAISPSVVISLIACIALCFCLFLNGSTKKVMHYIYFIFLFFSLSILLFFSYDILESPIFLQLGLLVLVTGLIRYLPEQLKAMTSRLLLFLFFIILQFVSIRLSDAFLALIIGAFFIKLSTKSSLHSWIFSLLISFLGIMFLPFVPKLFSIVQEYIQTNSYQVLILTLLAIGLTVYYLILNFAILKNLYQKLLIGFFLLAIITAVLGIKFLLTYESYNSQNKISFVSNVSDRVSGLDQNLTKSARVSMWKSAMPWIKDYPLFGTGLDTIKYMYPVYRRTDYGKLEGGHNYTPDRLHNEYLNTLATKGILGFLAYYGGFIFLWFIIILTAASHARSHHSAYLIMGCATGAGVYLVQVLFNFGVVATLFLFYVLIGLSVAISKSPKEYNL